SPDSSSRVPSTSVKINATLLLVEHPQHAVQDAAMGHVFHLDRRVEPGDNLEGDRAAGGLVGGSDGEVTARDEAVGDARYREGFAPGESQCGGGLTGQECQRQHTHAN